MGHDRPRTQQINQDVRARPSFPPTSSLTPRPAHAPAITPDVINRYLRQLGITEHVFIHEQDYFQFLEEKGLTELGRGGEGTVYFLRGHVVKVINPDAAAGSLREIAHMLHLNRAVSGTMGDRARGDWPTLLWIYVLSNGALSIGMKPFDVSEAQPGSTLFDRLTFGPELGRQHVLAIIRGIANSLLYAHHQGMIHHDLKPANIFVPGKNSQPPVVFDLGQALWQQPTWGRNWLRHEHNNLYWYNGTYRYMNHQRRLAHLAALARAESRVPSTAQETAFNAYQPAYSDDVFAFARILRDIIRSAHVQLSESDRTTLRQFYQKLMGLKRTRGTSARNMPRQGATGNPADSGSGLIRRITLAFLHPDKSGETRAVESQPRYNSMEQVQPEVERLMRDLHAGAVQDSPPPPSHTPLSREKHKVMRHKFD